MKLQWLVVVKLLRNPRIEKFEAWRCAKIKFNFLWVRLR